MMKRIAFLTLMGLILLSSCNNPGPPDIEWGCYLYNFVATNAIDNGGTVEILQGSYTQFVGLLTDAEGDLQVQWNEGFYVTPRAVEINLSRLTAGDISLSYNLSVFGQTIQGSQVLPAAISSVMLYEPNLDLLTAGNSVTGTLQANGGTVTITSLRVYYDLPTPFSREDCFGAESETPDGGTPTPEPSVTDTPAATNTPVPTATNTSCTTTTYNWKNSSSPNNWANGNIYWVNNVGYVLNGNYSGDYYNNPPQVLTDIVLYMTKSFSDAPANFFVDTANQSFVISSAALATHGGIPNAVSLAGRGYTPEPLGIFTVSASSSSTGSVAIQKIDLISCPSTPTPTNTAPTPTDTPTTTGTPTRTPVGYASPTKTGVGPPSTWTPTATRTATRTPVPTVTPPNTSTPGPTATFLPTITAKATLTPILVPTVKTPNLTQTAVSSSTAFATYDGVDITPLPGTLAPTFIVTPGLGTLANTPLPGTTLIATPDTLGDFHGDVTDGLNTAVAQVNLLPNDLSVVMPGLEGVVEYYGQAKYIASGTMLQEVFGITLYPAVQHAAFGIIAILFVSFIMIAFRIVLWAIRLAIWIIQAILKIIPFI